VISTLGVGGIIALKAAILVGALLVLHRRAAAAGAHPAATWGVTVLAGLTLTKYDGERPQLLSFLFAALLFLLVERWRDGGGRRWLFAVPPLMLAWANCHGGSVLGAALLAAWAGLLVVERRGAWPRGELRLFLGVAAASAVLSLASPVGGDVLVTILGREGNAAIQGRVSEYASPLQLFRETGYWQFLPYAAFTGLALVSLLPMLRGRRWGEGALVLLLAALSARAFRYAPFLLLVAGPWVARGLTELPGRWRRVLPWGAAGDGAVAALAAVALAVGTACGAMFHFRVSEGRFPEQAVKALVDGGARGRVLTSFAWGTYVAWYLPGQLRPYVDSRVLAFDVERFDRYTHMLYATPDGLDLLGRERFDFVLLPLASPWTGEGYPLLDVLRRDPRWALAHEDGTAALFVPR
jgi:hypothetical protein